MSKFQPVERICRVSGQKFTITPEDQEFYASMDVPWPTLHPFERVRRRLSFAPKLSTIYKRKCDATGKDLITYYHPQTPIKLYEREYWFSDEFDPTIYARDYDFSRSFFEQFRELLWDVPKHDSSNIQSEGCEYVILGGNNKNCYLISGYEAEDCMYMTSGGNRNTLDSDALYGCERCYECINCEKCFDVKFTKHSKECRNSTFLFDCIGCNDCFMCYGLRHKQYCIKNQQLTKEEYLLEIRKYNTGSYTVLENLKMEYELFCQNFPLQENHNIGCRNVVGDYLIDAEDCYYCFRGKGPRGCHYCLPFCHSQINCWDSTAGGAENCLEMVSGFRPRNCKFCESLRGGGYNMEYCINIMGQAHDLFGCVGLKKPSEYCILNKQYSKDEYFDLKKRIIEKMKEDGEYGEFFSASLSFIPYHDSLADEFRPIEESQVEVFDGENILGRVDLGGELKLDIHYRPIEKYSETTQDYEIKDDISAYRDEEKQQELLRSTLICQKTKRPYRIQSKELFFYLQNNLPIPRESLFARAPRRSREMMKVDIAQYNCDNCGKEIQTVHGGNGLQKVWCQACYQKDALNKIIK